MGGRRTSLLCELMKNAKRAEIISKPEKLMHQAFSPWFRMNIKEMERLKKQKGSTYPVHAPSSPNNHPPNITL